MSGSCFAEMSIHFRSGKFQALDMSNFFAKVMPKFFVDFSMTCARKVGHIECPGFVGTEIKRCSGMKFVFIIIFLFFRMPMIKTHCGTIRHRGRWPVILVICTSTELVHPTWVTVSPSSKSLVCVQCNMYEALVSV